MTRAVDFYFSLGSRYSYLAFTQLDAVSARTGCAFRLRPIGNHAIMAKAGADPFLAPQPVSGQYDWAYREKDATRWAKYYGVPFREPRNFRADPPHLRRACLAAEGFGALKPMAAALFRDIFVSGLTVPPTRPEEIAAEIGLDRIAFAAALISRAIEEREAAILAEATEAGIFGVPSFVVDGEMFWGNDRLMLLEHFLATG